MFFTELHEQRLDELRKKMKWLDNTDWKYTPAQKLIGLDSWNSWTTQTGSIPQHRNSLVWTLNTIGGLLAVLAWMFQISERYSAFLPWHGESGLIHSGRMAVDENGKVYYLFLNTWDSSCNLIGSCPWFISHDKDTASGLRIDPFKSRGLFSYIK